MCVLAPITSFRCYEQPRNVFVDSVEHFDGQTTQTFCLTENDLAVLMQNLYIFSEENLNLNWARAERTRVEQLLLLSR